MKPSLAGRVLPDAPLRTRASHAVVGGVSLPGGSRRPSALSAFSFALLVFLFLGAPLAVLRAEYVLSVPTNPGAEVAIKLATPTAQPPRFGFAPVRVTIENSATQERTWQIQFQSGVAGQFPGRVGYDCSFTVPAGQTRETWVYVPVAEPGTPGGAPSFATTLASATPGRASLNPGASAVISKSPGFTTINRTIRQTTSGRTLALIDIVINETTGEMTTTSRSPNGGSPGNTNTVRPPRGTDVVYSIDPTTGVVSTQHSTTAPGGTPHVTVVTGAGGSGGLSVTSPTNVRVEPTATGIKVTRTLNTPSFVGGPPRSITEVREIDAQTGLITTTTIPLTPGAAVAPQRTTPPLNPGTETTYTVNPTTGGIGTTTRIAANPAAPPKVTIVTGPGSVPVSTASTSAPVPPRPSGRLMPGSYNGPPMMLSAEVNGPGISSARVAFPSMNASANMRPMGATLALERVLRETLNNEGVASPNLAAIAPAELPADWRIWSGFACVFLPADDYAALNAARRAALRGWVALGGQLVLVPEEAGGKSEERLGAGSIRTLALPIKAALSTTEWNDLGLSLGGTVGYPDADSLVVRNGTPLSWAVAEKEPGTTWLTLFLISFAIMVGPVNLFVLAPATKRHRLFLTTPLISLVAAIVLGVTIFVQDGVGGDGLRHTLVVFLPGDNQAAVIQEQSARTGFLTNRTFPLTADTQLTVLPLEEESLGRIGSFSQTPTFFRDDTQGKGNWFRSRGRHAHLVQRLLPTRGRVERIGISPTGAPIVQSNLAHPLREFVVVDERGALWAAAELVPGRQTTLTLGGTWAGDLTFGGTRRFSQLFAVALLKSPGRWRGKGDPSDLGPVPTLAAVDWQRSDVVYTGLLEGGATGAKEATR
jgi:hypothetical protein